MKREIISRLDYLAAMALQGLLAQAEPAPDNTILVKQAVKIAVLLQKELEKEYDK